MHQEFVIFESICQNSKKPIYQVFGTNYPYEGVWHLSLSDAEDELNSLYSSLCPSPSI